MQDHTIQPTIATNTPESQNSRISEFQNPEIPTSLNSRITKYLPLLAALALLLLLPKLLGLAGLNQEWLKEVCTTPGGYGPLVYLALGATLVGIGFSRQVVCFLGGFVFGLTKGLVLATLASGLGCLLAVSAARLFRAPFQRRFGNRLGRINSFLAGNSFQAAMAIRFLPIGSNLLTNLGAGISRSSISGFFWGSMVGYIPQTIIFTIMGSGVGISSTWLLAISIILLGCSATLSRIMLRRYQATRFT